jgi:hypothetical protein
MLAQQQDQCREQQERPDDALAEDLQRRHVSQQPPVEWKRAPDDVGGDAVPDSATHCRSSVLRHVMAANARPAPQAGAATDAAYGSMTLPDWISRWKANSSAGTQ